MKRETAVGSLLEIWDKFLGVLISGEQKERYGHNICLLIALEGAVLGLAKSVCWCLILDKTFKKCSTTHQKKLTS